MIPKPISRRWNPWPICIISYFTVAIVGCTTFIIFCNRHPADLVAADYYEQEVRYQGQINRIQHAQQDAQSASVSYDAAARMILVRFPPRQSATSLTGTIQLYRPSAVNLDQQLKLAPDSRGIQQIDAAALKPGLWKVRVSWTDKNQEYYTDQKVVIGNKT